MFGIDIPELDSKIAAALRENSANKGIGDMINDISSIPDITSVLDKPSSYMIGEPKGYGDLNYGMAEVNPYSVAGTEGQYIKGSLGSKEGAQQTTGILGRGSESIGSDWMSSVKDNIPSVLAGLAQAANQPKAPAPSAPSISMAPGLGYGSSASNSALKNKGVLGDSNKRLSGILSSF